MDALFEKYSKELEDITKELPLKQAIKSKRKGIINMLIDKLVMSRFFWQEAFGFLAILQTIVIFTALVPQSVYTINDFLSWLHIPFALPVGFSSVITISFIIFIFIFGYVTVRLMKTTTISAEYGAKTSPSLYLMWKKLDEIEEKLKDLEDKK
jgi:hypothetical protein